MAKNEDTARALYNALIELWNEVDISAPRSYSGRAMYGDRCIGLDITCAGDLFGIGMELGRLVEGDLPDPIMDSMGRGFIAYWPTLPWLPDFEEKE